MVFDSFEEFMEEVWDYVDVVTDDYWEENHSFIREMTKDVFEHYKSVLHTQDMLTTKQCGALLDIAFKHIMQRDLLCNKKKCCKDKCNCKH